jgi:phosphate transport system protein
LERFFDSQLDDLKRLILNMGGHVELALDTAMASLNAKDVNQLAKVHEIEQKINQEHINVDVACTDLLAKQGPVAKDLRLIVSIIKINTDLERMGDQSVNIAYTSKDYLSRGVLPQIQLIHKMGLVVKNIVKESLDCFVKADVDLAKKVLMMDDEIDAFKQQVFDEIVAHMKKNPQDIEAGLDLILIARNLERLGDHATNIAEDVIFAFTGRDVRHSAQVK